MKQAGIFIIYKSQMRKMKDSYVKHCVEDDLRIERVHYEVGRSPAWDLLVNGSVSLVLNLGGGVGGWQGEAVFPLGISLLL